MPAMDVGPTDAIVGQESIADLETKVRTFDRGGARFSSVDMQRELDAKRAELQKLNTIVRDKEVCLIAWV